jgi:hypothetical protein
MQAPTYPGDGTVNGGVIRRTQSVQVPWNYTQQDWVPSDPAVGTAVYVDWQGTIGTGTGPFGPTAQTGYYGPRGVFQLEGLVRFARDMTAFGFAPVGYGDFMNIANDAGVARDLAPSWAFLAGRSVLADGAICELVGTDVNDGGAAFVDSAFYGTVRGGTLDGATNDIEIVSFLAMPGLGGDTDMRRVVGFDVQGAHLGWHPTLPNPTDHWAAAGLTLDANSVTLTEQIGLRIQEFTLGDTKVGVDSAHMVKVLNADQSNADQSAAGDQPVVAIAVGTGRTITLDDPAGFRSGAQFVALAANPILVYESDGGVLGSFNCFQAAPILKNATGEAHTIPLANVFATRPTLRGDGAALTVSTYIGLHDDPVSDIVAGGTVAITVLEHARFEHAAGTGVTTATRTGARFRDATGSGTVTTQIGLDIDILAKAATNIGIRNASTEVDTPAAQTLSAAGNAITATAKVKALTNSTGGSLTLTSAPTIADGQNGQIVELVNVGAQDIVLQDQGTLPSSNLRLTAASITLTPRDSVRLRYNATVGDWVQSGPLVNVL